MSSDSVVYIRTAESLQAGTGFFYRGSLMTHYPPVYSLILAAAGFLTGDIVGVARLLNALLFGTNLLLVAVTVRKATEHSLTVTICVVTVSLFSAVMFSIHRMVWSEPLFLTFSLAGIIFLSRHINRPGWPSLLASAVFLGLASATRYIGIALIPPAVVSLLAYRRGTAKYRVRDAIVWLLIACAPLSIWSFYTAQTGQSWRSFAVHPPSALHLAQFADALHSLFPIPGPDWLLTLLYAFIAGLSAVLLVGFYRPGRERLRDSDRFSPVKVISAMGIMFSASYMALLVIVIFFFDAGTPADKRLLSPVFVLLLLAVSSLAWAGSRAMEKPGMRLCCAFLLLGQVAANTAWMASSAVRVRRDGSDYSSRRWRVSEGIAYLRTLPGELTLYSNRWDAVDFLTGRQALPVPAKKSAVTLEPNTRFEDEIQAVCADVREGRAKLVWLSSIHRWYLPTQEELDSICSLPVLHVLADATIYGRRPDSVP